MSLRSIVHCYQSPFTHESRILRELRSSQKATLFDRHEVFAVGDPHLKSREVLEGFIEIHRAFLFFRRLKFLRPLKALYIIEWVLRGAIRYGILEKRSVVQCHSLPSLIIGVAAKFLKGSKIVYDAHELETETIMSGSTRKKIYKWLERKLIHHANAILVVSPSIESWYVQTYGSLPIRTVLNIPDLTSPKNIQRRNLKKELGIGEDTKLFIYLGVLNRGRGVDLLINAFQKTPSDTALVFVGYGPLTQRITEAAQRNKRIFYLPAVSPDQVAQTAAGADVGLSIIEDLCLSYRYSLPNKIFEYVKSDLPILVSDLPDSSKIVDTWQVGWKAPLDSDKIQSKISEITWDDIAVKRENLNQLRKNMGWSFEEKKLTALYQEL